MTKEKDKSKNVPVIYIITVLNFKVYKIFLISYATFCLKQGTNKIVTSIMNTIIAIRIMNIYWLIFIKILSEVIPEF